MTLSAVSLFSGCGGSDTGLVNAGFDVLFANDTLAYAADVYQANLPETDFQRCRIQDIASFPVADLLVGCYPCQGYSQGGARDAIREINYLFLEFGRALRIVKPKAFIVENVSGLIHANNESLFAQQLINFHDAGYHVKWQLLNAAEFGVAQERRRVLIVGINDAFDIEYRFPHPSHGPNADQPFVTIGQALDGMPEWPEGQFNTEPFHWYYMSRNRRRDWDEVSKTIVSKARHIPLHPMSPPLIRSGPDKYVFAYDGAARRFSYREAARLQGFPKAIKFPDTAGMYSRYKVIGNAVPPPLFEAVVRALPDIW